jgi:hypothetical protein
MEAAEERAEIAREMFEEGAEPVGDAPAEDPGAAEEPTVEA